MADPPAPEGGGGGSVFTNQYGALKGWQWVALIGAAGGLYLYLQQRKAAASSSSTGADTTALDTGQGPVPGSSMLQPIIIQNGPPSQPPTPALTNVAYQTNPQKIVGPAREYVPASGDTLANLLLKSGLLTKGASTYDPTSKAFTVYKTTPKFGGPVRPFNANVPIPTLTAVLLKEGIITQVPVAQVSTVVNQSTT